MSNQENKEEIGCFGTFIAGIVFFVAWSSIATAVPVLGWFLGWIPAVIIAVVAYFASYLALWLIWVIFLFVCATGLFIYFSF